MACSAAPISTWSRGSATSGGVPTVSSVTKSSSPPGGTPSSTTFGTARCAARRASSASACSASAALTSSASCLAWCSRAVRSSGRGLRHRAPTSSARRAVRRRGDRGPPAVVGGEQGVDERLVGAPQGAARPAPGRGRRAAAAGRSPAQVTEVGARPFALRPSTVVHRVVHRQARARSACPRSSLGCRTIDENGAQEWVDSRSTRPNWRTSTPCCSAPRRRRDQRSRPWRPVPNRKPDHAQRGAAAGDVPWATIQIAPENLCPKPEEGSGLSGRWR